MTSGGHSSQPPSSVLVSGDIAPLVREGAGSAGGGDIALPWLSSPQLGRSAGPPLLQLLLDLLRSLVIHCEQLDAQNRQKYEAVQAEADLFLDMESVASLELANDKVLPPASVRLLPAGLFLSSHREAFPPLLIKNKYVFIVGTCRSLLRGR